MKVTVVGPVGYASNGPVDAPHCEKGTARCELRPEPDKEWRELFYKEALDSVYPIDGIHCRYDVKDKQWDAVLAELKRLVAVANALDTRK